MSGIVVGFNANPEGEAAVRRGVEEAALRRTKVVVVFSETSRLDESGDRVVESLGRVHEILEGADVEHELRHLVGGADPVQDVLHAAEEVAADLIVIGIRRRSPVGKLILGSHAQAILLEATAPVLAVKA